MKKWEEREEWWLGGKVGGWQKIAKEWYNIRKARIQSQIYDIAHELVKGRVMWGGGGSVVRRTKKNLISKSFHFINFHLMTFPQFYVMSL